MIIGTITTIVLAIIVGGYLFSKWLEADIREMFNWTGDDDEY